MDVERQIDPNAEVKKLQETIRQLEKQNEALRSQNQQEAVRQQNGEIDNLSVFKSNSNIDSGKTNESFRENLTIIDFEDVDSSSLSSHDESWLYFNTKATNSEQPNVLSWVRQEFDHPSADVASAKLSLISKLEEAARIRHSSSSPLLGSQPATSKSTSSLYKSADDSRSSTPASKSVLQRRPGHATPENRIAADAGSRTITLPKQRPGPGVSGPMHGEGDQQQSSMEGSYYLGDAADISDIENLAKQQEANLRQNLTPSSRKALRTKQTVMDGESGPHLSPSRFDPDGSYMTKHRGSVGSDHSTPPDSPHQLSQSQNIHSYNANGKDSQSLHNNAPIMSMSASLQRRAYNSSDSSLDRNSVHSTSSDDGTSRRLNNKLAPESLRGGPSSGRSMLPPASSTNYRNLQQPQIRKSQPSGLVAPQQRAAPRSKVSGIAQPAMGPREEQRGVSPQRSSGLPQPRRQIMKPGSIAAKSSLPTFRRSGIPAPKTSTSATEESWQDGCF